MKKSDEIANPTSCLNRAQDDEPIFVLRAHDPDAGHIVELWAHRYIARKMHENNGNVTQAHADKANEALQLAEQMKIWNAEQSETQSS